MPPGATVLGEMGIRMNKLSLKDLRATDFMVSACIAIPLALAMALLGDWIGGSVVAFVVGFGFAMAMRALTTKLQHLVEAPDRVVLQVKLNGIEVGTITEADYARFRVEAYGNWRNSVAQLLNIGRVAINLFSQIYVAVPIGMFWCALFAWIFYPEAFALALDQLRTATPSELSAASVIAGRLLLVSAITLPLFGMMFGMRFGFVNCFAEDTAHSLRKHLGVAAEGDIVLWSQQKGGLEIYDLRAALKQLMNRR